MVKQLFAEAAELAGADRDRFLAERCGDDAALKVEVLALLRADVTGPFLESAPSARSEAEIPARIGRYAISRRIGEGGMGSVFEAVQDNPRRSIALKLLKGGLFSTDALRRFEYEAHVLASLQHPGIAQIYEAGTQAIGGVSVPYFAMELIPDARSITDFSRQQKLDLRRRLVLFAEVCEAVHHGHQRGIIHRDLKPSNILVDSAGRPRVIDFGIARSIVAGAAAATLFTSRGQIVGTLPYMSPEQFGGSSGAEPDVDVRSDVYSLGVMLYELLCERLPYDVARADVLEAARIIREEPPTRPSTVQRLLRGDLETIVLKALDKEPARRYQTVSDLARDIHHYLSDEPIEAHRESSVYLLRKMIRRHRAAFTVLTAFVLLITGATIVGWTLMLRARDSAQRARESLRESLVSQARARRQIVSEGRRIEALEALSKAAAIRTGDDLRGEVITTLAVPDIRRHLVPTPPGSNAVTFSNDLSRCVTSTRDGGVIIVGVPDGVEIGRVPPPSVPAGVTERWYCNSHYFVRTFVQQSGLLRLEVWQIPEAILRLVVPDIPRWDEFDVSPDDRTLAVGRADHAIHLFDLVTGKETRRIQLDRNAARLRFDPSGTRLARFHDRDGEASILNLENGTWTRVFGETPIAYALAWSPDGNILAGAEEEFIHLWDVSGHKEIGVLRGHVSAVTHLAFSHDGRMLVSYGWENASIIWDLTTLRPLLRSELILHSFGPNDRTIGGVTALDGMLRAFSCDFLFRDAYRMIGGDFGVDAFRGQVGSTHPAGRIAVGSVVEREGQFAGIQFFDVWRGCVIGRMNCGGLSQGRFDPSGASLYTTGPTGLLRWPVRIDAVTLRIGPPRQLVIDPQAGHFDLSADGRRLAVVSRGKRTLTVIDTAHPDKQISYLLLPQGNVVAVSPKGKWAVVTTWHGSGGEVWDLHEGAMVARLEVPGSALPAFSPDGRWLTIRDWNYVRFMQPDAWQEVHRFNMGHGTRVGFSSDGRLAAVADEGKTIKLIDTVALEELAVFEAPDAFGNSDAPCFVNDSTLALFAGRGALLQLWDLRRIRSTLAEMGMDWDLPPIPAALPAGPLKPLRLEADLGFLAPAAASQAMQ